VGLKGDLDILISHISKLQDPELLDHVMVLRIQVLQLIHKIRELEKENETIQDLLKNYDTKTLKGR
jgi:hypothetical protein